MKSPRHAALIFLICFIADSAKSQDLHFSQYYNTLLLVNPAQAGVANKYLFGLNYRDQWSAVTNNPYRTFAGVFDMRINKEENSSGYLGAGFAYISDKSGDGKMSTNQGNFYLSGGLKLSPKNTVAIGLQGGLASRQVDMNAFSWDNQFDGGHYNPDLVSGESSEPYKFSATDFGVGMLWNYDKGEETYATNNNTLKINAGFSILHINKPEYSFSDIVEKNQYMKIVIHGSMAKGIKNSNGTLEPSFIYSRQGPQQETIFGIDYKLALKDNSKYTGFVKASSIYFGMYFRWRDASIAKLEYETGNYSIGLSYDLNVSGLKEASKLRGGTEVSLKIYFDRKKAKLVSP